VPCWLEPKAASCSREARLAHDEVLADFLGKAQVEIVERVGMLFAQRITLSRVF
jgi:hypothetical protein